MPSNIDTSRSYVISSVTTTHFTSNIAQNAGEDESISFPTEISTWGCQEVIIEAITIQQKQATANEWDVYLWRKSTTADTTLDSDMFIEYVNFPSTDGKQIAGANQFYYGQSGLSIPYRDEDNTSKIHCTLVNRSAGAKSDVVMVRFIVRPVIK